MKQANSGMWGNGDERRTGKLKVLEEQKGRNRQGELEGTKARNEDVQASKNKEKLIKLKKEEWEE